MTRRTWVKVCGLTREEDVEAVALSGADAVGFVFANSPRHVDASRARDLVSLAHFLASDLLTVGVFLGFDSREIAAIVEVSRIDAIQFYGEVDEFARLDRSQVTFACLACSAADQPFTKIERLSTEESPDAVLFDGATPGSGKTFDWSALAPGFGTPPLILAGGLSPSNVGEAIQRVRPWGVDVSSGVEDSPGAKDAELIVDFIAEVRAADATPVSVARARRTI